MNKAAVSSSPLLEMQHILDYLLAFWGIIDDRIDSEQIRNIIKAGKRIERLDLYARLGEDREKLVREVHRLIPRVENSGLSYDPEKLKILKDIVENSDLDYYKIVSIVETIL